MNFPIPFGLALSKLSCFFMSKCLKNVPSSENCNIWLYPWFCKSYGEFTCRVTMIPLKTIALLEATPIFHSLKGVPAILASLLVRVKPEDCYQSIKLDLMFSLPQTRKAADCNSTVMKWLYLNCSPNFL